MDITSFKRQKSLSRYTSEFIIEERIVLQVNAGFEYILFVLFMVTCIILSFDV